MDEQSSEDMLEVSDDNKERENHEIIAQLARAGPAAAAVNSTMKRKKNACYENNPATRQNIQKCLLKKLKRTIDEFAVKIGKQAIILVAPENLDMNYRVFGTQPLQNIIKNLNHTIKNELEDALAKQAQPSVQKRETFHLPDITIDGIPTTVDKMTQAQLRAFIPLMLKYSTGRGKPGWGKESMRPSWWPEGIPWANIRIDSRTVEEKQDIPWTNVLRQIIIECYTYHDREDLLKEEEETKASVSTDYSPAVLHTVANPIDSCNPVPYGETGYLTTAVEENTDEKSEHFVLDENIKPPAILQMETEAEAHEENLASQRQTFLTEENKHVVLMQQDNDTMCVTPVFQILNVISDDTNNTKTLIVSPQTLAALKGMVEKHVKSENTTIND